MKEMTEASVVERLMKIRLFAGMSREEVNGIVPLIVEPTDEK